MLQFLPFVGYIMRGWKGRPQTLHGGGRKEETKLRVSILGVLMSDYNTCTCQASSSIHFSRKGRFIYAAVDRPWSGVWRMLAMGVQSVLEVSTDCGSRE